MARLGSEPEVDNFFDELMQRLPVDCGINPLPTSWNPAVRKFESQLRGTLDRGSLQVQVRLTRSTKQEDLAALSDVFRCVGLIAQSTLKFLPARSGLASRRSLSTNMARILRRYVFTSPTLGHETTGALTVALTGRKGGQLNRR